MRKTLFAVVACVALLSGVSLSGALADATAADVPKEPILLEKLTGTDKYEQVMFDHTGHAALDCTACHHTWDGASPIKSCSAEGCHTNTDVKVKKGVESLYAAYHSRNKEKLYSCVGCHAAKKKAGEKTGPTVCNKCHATKKKG